MSTLEEDDIPAASLALADDGADLKVNRSRRRLERLGLGFWLG